MPSLLCATCEIIDPVYECTLADQAVEPREGEPLELLASSYETRYAMFVKSRRQAITVTRYG